jgi:hypothetical protein
LHLVRIVAPCCLQRSVSRNPRRLSVMLSYNNINTFLNDCSTFKQKRICPWSQH